MSSKVSFTIRRPTSSGPPSHPSVPSPNLTSRTKSFTPHAVDSSDEDDEEGATELVTGFDQSGIQRLIQKPKPAGPLVIPALANRDWRAVARVRKQQSFIPDGAAAPTGKDGSQGGLGTRDSINSGPQVAGLVRREGETTVDENGDAVKMEVQEVAMTSLEKTEETEDERARRALLAGASGGVDQDGLTIDAIPLGGNESNGSPLDETDVYKQDVVTRPESATLADYERVPVSQFGAALLRGMGWKEGTAASRTRRGLVEPWLPTSRPALLGIGAKERPTEDIPDLAKGGKATKRPERRYVPLVKLEREGSGQPPPPRSRSRSPGRSGTSSRMASKSASPYPTDKDRQRRRRERDRSYEDYSYDEPGRERDRDNDRRGDRSNDDRQIDRRRDRGDRELDSERRREDRGGRGKDYRRDERGGSTRDRGSRY